MFELMVLATLMCQPCHGYELKRHLANFNPNNNKIYPTLRNLQEKGFLTSQVEVQEARPNRHIYTITEAGQNRFRELLADFDLAKAQNVNEFNLRISFSYLLDKATMKNVLRLREQALLQQPAVISLIPNTADPDDMARVTALHENLRRLQLDFLHKMQRKYR